VTSAEEQVEDLRRHLRATFDEVAALYDEICTLSGVPDGGDILEIGCGTGQATLPLAQRDYHISNRPFVGSRQDALPGEPGGRMASAAAHAAGCRACRAAVTRPDAAAWLVPGELQAPGFPLGVVDGRLEGATHRR
jgi:SAM-dependent methyltransferase